MSAPAAESLKVETDIYLKNMRALWRADLRLAQRIEDVPDESLIEVQVAKSGAPTVSMPRRDGRTAWLHSRYDPDGEAKRFADAVDIDKTYCFVITGFGLGYHVKALFERLRGDSLLLVIEPNPALVRTALESVDLSALLGSGKCLILTELDPAVLADRLTPHQTMMLLGTQFVAHPASEPLAPEFFAQARTAITDFITFARMSVMTVLANSRITARNVSSNLPTYLSTPPIDVMRSAFQGRPGIIVSAGPSLAKNMHELRRASGRAVVCCVQTAFKTLLAADIVPDFVTSLDFHEISRTYFEGIEDLRGVHLVAEPKATWHVIDAYKGPISLLGNAFAELLLGPELAGRGGLRAGATVAHLAFYLLEYLGCDPIVLVGQDLAYTGGVYYAPGMPIHDAWRAEFNRFCTIEMREWERIVRHRKMLRKATDVFGNEVYTDEQLFTYAQQFEQDFATTQARVIDATEGGVRKAGSEAMPLREVIGKYGAEPIPDSCYAYRRQVRWHDRSRLPAAKRELEARIEELAELRAVCTRLIEVLGRLKELTDRPTEFNRRLSAVDDLRVRVRKCERAYQIASTVSQHGELRRVSADYALGAESADGRTEAERAKRQLDRDIEFNRAITEGIDLATEILETAIERLTAAIEADDGSEGVQPRSDAPGRAAREGRA